ncbi:hypothetical protein J6590_078809 [Homalodisca vitripennis]|nr:hypothetical protein J6590_078809 [Homalodisca vitripennis]
MPVRSRDKSHSRCGILPGQSPGASYIIAGPDQHLLGTFQSSVNHDDVTTPGVPTQTICSPELSYCGSETSKSPLKGGDPSGYFGRFHSCRLVDGVCHGVIRVRKCYRHQSIVIHRLEYTVMVELLHVSIPKQTGPKDGTTDVSDTGAHNQELGVQPGTESGVKSDSVQAGVTLIASNLSIAFRRRRSTDSCTKAAKLHGHRFAESCLYSHNVRGSDAAQSVPITKSPVIHNRSHASPRLCHEMALYDIP